jgi:hypothetical protein
MLSAARMERPFNDNEEGNLVCARGTFQILIRGRAIQQGPHFFEEVDQGFLIFFGHIV